MTADNPRETARMAVLNVEAQHARVVEALDELDRLRDIAERATFADLVEPEWDLVQKYEPLTGLSAVAQVESRRIIKSGLYRRMNL
ncbi:hypothetical protein [Nocardia heshunensis]